jgi:RNA polymerase sigma factor (sigma-70 family)
MSDHHPVTDLVTWARNGDKQAWDALVERCAPLVWSTCRRHRLKDADADAVGQHVWLLLLDQLDNLSDPVALPGWVATTTRLECDRVLRTARGPLGARDLLETQTFPDEQAATAEQEPLAAECHAALRQVFLELPPGCQRLITLLTADPPVSYAEISARLGIPVGSIGPTRRRCVERLRRHPAIAALTNAKAQTAGGEIPDRPSAR